MTNRKPVPFTGKHHILLQDSEGGLVPMDQPYYRSWQIADKTWQILSDGDHSYLLEGEKEALLIDSGYGCGDIRAYCQTLTDKPVNRIANTHDHFDHTANNYLFDCALMSAETVPLATRPFPSFSGIDFPRDYPVEILDDGDTIDLGGRTLEVIKIPDHAVGSLAYLDRQTGILFSGDEVMVDVKRLNGSVARLARQMEKLNRFRTDFHTLYAGPGKVDPAWIDKYLAIAREILDGAEGEPMEAQPFPAPPQPDENGNVIWKRREPHPRDVPVDKEPQYKRILRRGDAAVIYDIRKILD